MSRRRRILFRIAALCLPFILIALVECGLRLAGYGGYRPSFRAVGPTAGGTLMTTDNRGPSSYFYANRSKSGSMGETTFVAPKPAGTIRVFCVGESAMKGFPQPPAFAWSSFLGEMLSDVWTDRRVEVINLGTTAIASFPALGILTESLTHEPDLIVIHCGHNEFFGAYGVASLHSSGNSPGAIRLQRGLRALGIVQCAQQWFGPRDDTDHDRTLMETMMGQAYLAPDDPLRDAAARNLGVHARAMVDRCKAAGVPVIVCTLPSNERDLAPLGTDDISSLSDEEQAQLKAALSEGLARLESDAAGAKQELQRVVDLSPMHALGRYSLGRAMFALAEHAEAAKQFQAAIDADPMPWRAPSRSVEAVRRAAADGGAVICDLAAAFRRASPGGCIGWELMDDHVHPSLQGQALWAAAVVETLTTFEGPLHVPRAAFEALPGWEEFAHRLGDNPYDRYGVAHTLRVLCNIPFIRRTNPGAFDRFNNVAIELERRMHPDVRQAMHEWQKPTTHPGTQRPASSMAGKVMIRLGRYDEAEQLYRVALRCVSPHHAWNLEYTYFLLAARERRNGGLNDGDRRLAAEAIERGRMILRFGKAESGQTERFMGRLHQLRGEWSEAIACLLAARDKVTSTDLVAVDQALVMSYVRIGNAAEARRLVQDGIAHSGQYAELYRQMLRLIPAGK
ncbi:MAG: hypothetical protein HUU22_06060 [Phycisphaerae bacterium]|nr:hypothetical protein [Phycisphaerae bacterium]NUQ45578.1 hypothetical protein [Phycisphaerae bacterium]